LELIFGDCGQVYFYIQEEDLKAGGLIMFGWSYNAIENTVKGARRSKYQARRQQHKLPSGLFLLEVKKCS